LCQSAKKKRAKRKDDSGDEDAKHEEDSDGGDREDEAGARSSNTDNESDADEEDELDSLVTGMMVLTRGVYKTPPRHFIQLCEVTGEYRESGQYRNWPCKLYECSQSEETQLAAKGTWSKCRGPKSNDEFEDWSVITTFEKLRKNGTLPAAVQKFLHECPFFQKLKEK
jgi:predicted  nucleic acid-binding Zn-ribbon protein